MGFHDQDQFVTTHWSLVLAAGRRGSADSDSALQQLCSAYWPALYAYVRRRIGDVHEAQDLTQAFFERVLEKGYLESADPARGRFRAYLITAFKHFLAKEWDKARAKKRGGTRRRISLDFAAEDTVGDFEPAEESTPEEIYERQWAVALLGRVMDRLQCEIAGEGRGQHFDALKGFLVRRGENHYADVAAELGITPAAARMAVSRMRQRYRLLLREEIAQTLASSADIDDEVRHLFAIFAKN